jgi:HD superfamily phosphohydrolase
MEPPKKIDRWRVERELGHGDFATVYLVRSGDTTAALKICPESNHVARERLELEAHALTTLEHPNIPRLLEQGNTEGRPYLVMELAAGESVQSKIEKNQALGRLYGDLETLHLMSQLLGTLVHVHSSNLVHRDIKDANVLHADGLDSLRLIDFGFCKESGTYDIRSKDSFWRAGSPRFSPPTKLDDSTYADPSHDVFAAGVLAYRMLTGKFPWSAGQTQGVAALRQLQIGQPLESVTETNSFVLPSISSWVSRLLDLDDRRRPTAEEALKDAQEILRTASGHEERRGVTRNRYAEVIRDPIHGDVRLTLYEYKALITKEMQRLRTVKQLGLTDMVFPGASHSRLSHSIGCVARVEQILRTIEERDGVRIDGELRDSARLYALTHDVLHIPFGHTFEDELGFFPRHDENSARCARLVHSEDSELGNLLRETEIGRALIPHLAGESTLKTGRTIFVDLVSGIIGADVLDYIDRDAYFCGLDSRIDSAIFRQFRIYALSQADDRRLVSLISGKYGLRVDREYAVETILKERYALFLKVYTHSTKAAASALLGKALYEEMTQVRSSRRHIRQEDIEWLSDDALIHRLAGSARPIPKRAATNLMYRNLPQGVYRGLMLGESDRDERNYRDRRLWLDDKGISTPDGRRAIEDELARQVGMDPHQVILYCPAKAPGYQQVEHWVTLTHDTTPPQQGSAFGGEIARRHLGLWELWVFAVDVNDPTKRSRLADVAQDRFGMDNMIKIDRLQGRLF